MNRMKESPRARETVPDAGSSRPTESFRVGFLGTGYIADWHAKALGTIPGVSLVAVCDKDLLRARDIRRTLRGGTLLRVAGADAR